MTLPDEPTRLAELPIHDLVLNRMRVGVRQRIQGGDLYRSLMISVHPDTALFGMADGLIMELVGKVYTEDLPPEAITQKTTVEMSGEVLCGTSLPDGPWMRWRVSHQGRRWYRLLVGWLPPIRHVYHHEWVPWRGEKEVTCQVDLRRFYAYPESQLGDHPGVGPVRVAQHKIYATWLQQ